MRITNAKIIIMARCSHETILFRSSFMSIFVANLPIEDRFAFQGLEY